MGITITRLPDRADAYVDVLNRVHALRDWVQTVDPDERVDFALARMVNAEAWAPEDAARAERMRIEACALVAYRGDPRVFVEGR